MAIHLLLTKAKTAMKDLAKKDGSSEMANTSENWLTFRGMMLDLYSVLDYTFFFLYCHFSNKGRVDLTRDARKLGFPYTPTGVRTQVSKNGEATYGEQDQRKSFVTEKMALLWGRNVKLGETANFWWKEIGDIILGVQPKLKVDDRGIVMKGDNPTVAIGDEESLAMLYFYRNCCAHRDLVRFHSEIFYLKIDCRTREMCLVEKSEEQEGYIYQKLAKGFYVMLPEVITRRSQCDRRLLLDVLEQLTSFVTEKSSKLIHASLLLPSATSILKSHVRGYRMLPAKFTTIEEKHRATVTLTSECGETVAEASSSDQCKEKAQEEACFLTLQRLARKEIFPQHPYGFFRPRYPPYYLPVTVNSDEEREFSTLVSKCNQHLQRKGLEVTMTHEGGEDRVRAGVYTAWATLSIKSADVTLVTLYRDTHEVDGKVKARTVANKELAAECIRLGFIQLIRK